MKKIILGAIVLIVSFMVIGCRPNYIEELNAAIDLYNTTEKMMGEVIEKANETITQTENVDELLSAYEDIIKSDIEALAVYEPMLVEVKGYEKGISDKESFNDFVYALEENIDFLKKDILDCGSWKTEVLVYQQMMQLMDEYEEYSNKINTLEISSVSKKEAKDVLNNYVEIFEKDIVELECMKKEMNDITVYDGQEHIDDTISDLDNLIKVIEDSIMELSELLESF